MKIDRLLAMIMALPLLAACATDDLAQPPVPLGEFGMGFNVVVTDGMQKVPISRDASGAEWEAALVQAMDDRFGRYDGNRLYNFGLSVDGFAIAPPGIPLVLSPKSVLVITANIWEDATATKLNPKGKQLTIFEGISGETMVGSGLTQTKEQQMAKLAFNAAKAVENWLLENPEWFDLPATTAAASVN